MIKIYNSLKAVDCSPGNRKDATKDLERQMYHSQIRPCAKWTSNVGNIYTQNIGISKFENT